MKTRTSNIDCQQFLDDNWKMIKTLAGAICGYDDRNQHMRAELTSIAALAFFEAEKNHKALRKTKFTSVFYEYLKKYLLQQKSIDHVNGDRIIEEHHSSRETRPPEEEQYDAEYHFEKHSFLEFNTNNDILPDSTHSAKGYNSHTQSNRYTYDLYSFSSIPNLRLVSVLDKICEAATRRRKRGQVQILPKLLRAYSCETREQLAQSIRNDLRQLLDKDLRLFMATCVNGTSSHVLVCAKDTENAELYATKYGDVIDIREFHALS
jgi:hypothetical protein